MADQLDLGSRTVSGAYFLRLPVGQVPPRGSVERAIASASGGLATESEEHLVWTRENEASTLKDAAIELIRSAKKKVFIASFRIGDGDLLDELFVAADRLQGSVYVISMLDMKSLTAGYARGDDDTEVDEPTLKKQFAALVERGIYVRGHENFHAKFLIVDDEVALVSSANLESRAFTTTTEIGVVSRDKHEVERLARLFALLWHGSTWEAEPALGYKLATRTASQASFHSIPRAPREQRAIWTWKTQTGILEASRQAIRKAEKDLILASFSLSGMSAHRELLLNEVGDFKKRTGSRARLLLRARNHVLDSRRDGEEFLKLGCEVVADLVTHAKCIIADGKEALLFSANFDAKYGLTAGVDAGFRLLEPRLVRETVAFFEVLLGAAPIVLKASPTHRELQGLESRGVSPWQMGSTVRVSAKETDWKAFASLEEGWPVLFEPGTDGRVVLTAGRRAFSLDRPGGDGRWRLSLGAQTGVDSKKQLDGWLSHWGGQGRDSSERGVCSAMFVRE